MELFLTLVIFTFSTDVSSFLVTHFIAMAVVAVVALNGVGDVDLCICHLAVKQARASLYCLEWVVTLIRKYINFSQSLYVTIKLYFWGCAGNKQKPSF